jgi:hypothetical protein
MPIINGEAFRELFEVGFRTRMVDPQTPRGIVGKLIDANVTCMVWAIDGGDAITIVKNKSEDDAPFISLNSVRPMGVIEEKIINQPAGQTKMAAKDVGLSSGEPGGGGDRAIGAGPSRIIT